MRFQFIIVAVLLSVVCAAAQDNVCSGSKVSVIGKENGVVVEKVMLSGPWGSNSATVFLPDKDIAEGAVVFSHSAIDRRSVTTDLLPMAMTLAHAGAAVIVPERHLVWPPTDSSMNRDGGAVVCAAHWLVDNTKLINGGTPVTNDRDIVIRSGYAYVGPSLCDPKVPSDCRLMFPLASEAVPGYHRKIVWVPVGATEDENKITSDGGLSSARWLQRNLGLSPITSIIPTRLPLL